MEELLKKRPPIESIDEFEGKQTKIIHLLQKEELNFGITSASASPLLTPKKKLSELGVEYSFRKRIFRYVKKDPQTNTPKTGRESILFKLRELQYKYRKEKREENVEHVQEKRTSKKNEKFGAATQLLLTTDFSFASIAKMTRLKKHDISNLSKRIKESKPIIPGEIKRKRIIKENHLDFIKNLLTDENKIFSSLKEIKKELITSYPELSSVSLGCLREAMTQNNFSFKKVKKYHCKLNTEQMKKERLLVSRELINNLYENEKVIFVDETSIQLNSKPFYAWGLKGKKTLVPKPSKPINYSLICAITPSKVLGCQIIKGAVKQHDFLCFIINLLQYYQFDGSPKKVIIFLDNASVHHSRFVINSLMGYVRLLYNAAYSPMLNPIEEFFSKLKKMIRKQPTTNDYEIIKAVENSFSLFQKSDFRGYIRHTLDYAESSLSLNDIY